MRKVAEFKGKAPALLRIQMVLCRYQLMLRVFRNYTRQYKAMKLETDNFADAPAPAKLQNSSHALPTFLQKLKVRHPAITKDYVHGVAFLRQELCARPMAQAVRRFLMG